MSYLEVKRGVGWNPYSETVILPEHLKPSWLEPKMIRDMFGWYGDEQ